MCRVQWPEWQGACTAGGYTGCMTQALELGVLHGPPRSTFHPLHPALCSCRLTCLGCIHSLPCLLAGASERHHTGFGRNGLGGGRSRSTYSSGSIPAGNGGCDCFLCHSLRPCPMPSSCFLWLQVSPGPSVAFSPVPSGMGVVAATHYC